MKLGFDLHGVIIRLLPAMERYYKETVGFELKKGKPAMFNFEYPDWYDARRFGPDIAASIVKYVHICEPVEGSIGSLIDWYNMGHDIIIITATAKSTMDANEAWLQKHLPCPYQIHRVDSHEGKVAICRELDITHYIDDRFKTCVELSDIMEKVYLFNAYYNRGPHRILPKNVKRVYNIQGAIDDILDDREIVG